MPRGRPTSIVEQRITLGTFERQWMVEQENYLKSQVTQAKTAAVVVPVAIGVTVIGGTCALGYALYAGMCAIGDAVPSNPFKAVGAVNDWVNPFMNSPQAVARKAVALAKVLNYFGFDGTEDAK